MVVIDRPIAEVFEYTTNPKNTPLWVESIGEEICDPNPTQLGGLFKNRSAKGKWSVYSVTKFEKDKLFELNSEDKNYFCRYTYSELSKGETELEYLEWVVNGELEGLMPAEAFDKLKRILESTSDEMLDLVNEKDKVIGQVKKSEANTNPKLIHREIGVILFDENKRVLLQKRSLQKKVFPGYWTISVAGHVISGDTEEQTAHRELLEEMGVDTKLVFLYKALVKFPWETHFDSVFMGKIPTNFNPVLQTEEVAEIKLVSEKELEKMMEAGEKVEEGSLALCKRFWSREFDTDCLEI